MSTKEFIETRAPSQKNWGKRIFDICFSALALFFGSPLYLTLLILVKCTSKGPIFYTSHRMGQNGQLLRCYKFRTMCTDARERLQNILLSDPQMKYEWDTFHKLKKDPRLTVMGHFLRKSSLDELPQFWNVLRGDLSIVGPRPIEIENRENALSEIRGRYGDKTDKILSVKPGITCIWQIKGRNELTFEKRALLEEEYVDTRSFFLDLKIILKTIFIWIFPKGAY